MIDIALYIILLVLVIAVPAYTWLKGQGKYLAAVMILFNVYWLYYSYVSYWAVIPENESGVVILGMLVFIPLVMVGVNLLLIPATRLCAWAFNKAFKRDDLQPPLN